MHGDVHPGRPRRGNRAALGGAPRSHSQFAPPAGRRPLRRRLPLAQGAGRGRLRAHGRRQPSRRPGLFRAERIMLSAFRRRPRTPSAGFVRRNVHGRAADDAAARGRRRPHSLRAPAGDPDLASPQRAYRRPGQGLPSLRRGAGPARSDGSPLSDGEHDQQGIHGRRTGVDDRAGRNPGDDAAAPGAARNQGRGGRGCRAARLPGRNAFRSTPRSTASSGRRKKPLSLSK